MKIEKVTRHGKHLRSVRVLSPLNQDLAVALVAHVLAVDPEEGARFTADIIADDPPDMFPDATKRMTKDQRLLRCLETPIQVDDHVVRLVVTTSRRMYDKTKKVVVSPGTLEMFTPRTIELEGRQTQVAAPTHSPAAYDPAPITYAQPGLALDPGYMAEREAFENMVRERLMDLGKQINRLAIQIGVLQPAVPSDEVDPDDI